MERNCKNCNDLIYAGKSHCSSCGCKWIDNRITMRQVGNDFADMYIGIDTKFVRTFLDLFRKPDAVIKGYMSGRRMNYMDAVRYLLLALFFTGIYTFVLKNTGVIDELIDLQIQETIEAYKDMGMDQKEAEESASMAKQGTAAAFEFQGFILLITIPLLALVGRITFWNKRYFNFTEQMVFYMYTYGHFMIVTTPISIVLVFLIPNYITYLSFITFPLLYIYNGYCYKKCFNLSNMTIITKALISVFVFLGFTIAMTIVGIIIVILLKLTNVV